MFPPFDISSATLVWLLNVSVDSFCTVQLENNSQSGVEVGCRMTGDARQKARFRKRCGQR